MSREKEVVIIGGGWAGLAAALELTNHGVPVRLFESSPQLGGRARNAPFKEQTVDNGQHLLIGAYHEILQLLGRIGTDESEVLLRKRLHLKVFDGDGTLDMHAPSLPAPLHLAWAQLSAGGLGLRERLLAISMSLRLLLSGFALQQDISVKELLQHYSQSENIIKRLWEPLCIATLNTPITKASAQVFLRVLRDSFTRSSSDADLLIPKVALGDLFPSRAASYLQQHGADIRLRQRVEGLRITNKKLTGIIIDGKEISCGNAIIATAPRAASRLLKEHAELSEIHHKISQLESQPIITVYLQYHSQHRLEEPMLGMCGTVSQWLFDRSHCGNPGLISVVVSAEGKHEGWDNQTLTQHIIQELTQQFPDWPRPVSTRVIREKYATFECRVGIEALRPDNVTPVDGLWLAGDYTATGYPATLEGAVRSGMKCARMIIEQP